MPSRRSIALILGFWLITTGYVVYQDVRPRLFASDPPQLAIELADEATQTVPIRWTIYRGDKKIGRMTSQIQHIDADDTFWFHNHYIELELDAHSVSCKIPNLTSSNRLTRGGDLREQKLVGKVEVYLKGLKLAEAQASIRGTVTGEQLVADCDIESPLGNFKQKLDPVPVRTGQPLNPLQPVNRLTHLQPGQSWPVEMSSPLDEAIAAVCRQKLGAYGVKLPESKPQQVFARVPHETGTLMWQEKQQTCWWIEYRQDEPIARTWVRVSDGKVLKQEAFRGGENLSIVRED
jgi:hypothetical protein